MKKLSMRSSLLLGVLLAVCAFVPALASAASFSQVGTTHQLTSNGLAFTADTGPLGQAGSTCALSQFDSTVTSASLITINAARFDNCHGVLAANPCTATVVPTGLPWTANAPNTTNIQIHSVNIDILFEQTPGAAACPAQGAKVLLTGTLTGGSWTPATNTADLVAESGLAAHFLGTGQSSSTTVSGNIRDPAGTLRLFD
jgi:hypothetical protein